MSRSKVKVKYAKNTHFRTGYRTAIFVYRLNRLKMHHMTSRVLGQVDTQQKTDSSM